MKTVKRILILLQCLALFPGFGPAPARAAEWKREEYYAAAKAEFGDLTFSDPQIIPDEEFFGTWDDGQWVLEPYFDYEGYPDMHNIEEAAKAGDYDTCKEGALAYYREKHSHYAITSGSSQDISSRKQAQIEAAFDNFFPAYQNSISARVVFDKNDGWQTADLLQDVKEAANNAGTKIAKFQIVAPKKDGYAVEIDTRESNNKPYIMALVNNIYKRFDAAADTYVSGTSPNTPRGGETKMFVEQSVSSIGITQGARFDEYSKISFFQFDFTGLKSSDKITKATLYLHGKMVESTSPAGIRVFSDTKSLFIMPFIRGNTSLDEYGLNFTTYLTFTSDFSSFDGELCPTFGKSLTTGAVTGNYILQIVPYLRSVSDGYVCTGDENFAWHTIRILLGLIEHLGDYETLAKLCSSNSSSLQGPFYIGQKGNELPEILDRIINSEYMTAEVFGSVIKHMWMTGHYLVKEWGKREENNNIGTYATRGLVALAMFYPEFQEAHLPLTELKNPAYPGSMQGGWIEVAKFRQSYKLSDDVHDDGSSIEVSIEYATESFVNLLYPVTVARRLCIDPTPYMDKNMVERLEKNAMYILNNTNPWFGCWQVGDSGAYDGNYASRMKNLLTISSDPNIEYFISGRKTGRPPDHLTAIYDTVSKVTFRNSWEANAVAAHLEATSGQTSHGHNDDLSLTLAAYGQYLLIDPKMQFYKVSDPLECWLSSTRGHNTVEINNTIAKGGKTYSVQEAEDYFGEVMRYPVGQKASKISDLHPENREINTIYDFVRGETFGYTNNNAMDSDYQVIRDTLFMRKGYFIVTDYIKPQDIAKLNSYKQLWHFLPMADISVNAEENTIRTRFDGKANVVVATVDRSGDLELTLRDGLYAFSKDNCVDAKYAYFEENGKGTMTFNTLLYPLTPQKNVSVYTRKINLDIDDDKANAFSAQIEDKKTDLVNTIHFYTLFDENSKQMRSFDYYSTDGALAVIEKSDMGYEAAALRQGKELKDSGSNTSIIYSSEEISELGVEWNADVIDLATSKTEGAEKLDVSKLTVVANNNVSSVRLNGKPIKFNTSGKYIYFGLNPIIEDNTQQNPSDENGLMPMVKSPIHGGGGAAPIVTLEDTEVKFEDKTEKPIQFKDISDHWAKEDILAAAEAKLVLGDESGNFNPDETITRAELIVIVARTLGAELTGYDGAFSDVKEGDWYAEPIAWALEQGIISADNYFRPNDSISREEMCKILMLFAEKLGKADTYKAHSADFDDSEQISEWAKEFVSRAANLGFVQGMGNNLFSPMGFATRAQVVTVIWKILKS